MAFEPGGKADKLGNRHEDRWLAKQLLCLLNEEIISVTVEDIGDEEKGVDLWVTLKNGKRRAYQCKARNASKESWTIPALSANGVLSYCRFQLDCNPDAEFVFVSGASFLTLKDICDSARYANGNAEDYYQYQIKKIGKSRQTLFQDYCKALGLNHNFPEDRVIAHNYLCRTYIELYPDDNNSRDELLTRASFLCSGNPETVVAILQNYAINQDRMGAPIYADELWAFLRTLDIYPKQLAHDMHISPAIERLQEYFFDSISPRLIKGQLVKREETDQCINALERDGLVILHGSAGTGKSGVLYELTIALAEKQELFLPIRLDRWSPKNTAIQFGNDLGLPDSPVNCLAAFAGNRASFLILDQLDAIRWTASHSSNALDVCKEIIRQVQSFRKIGMDIRVVLSCRTFDKENDPEIKSWLSDNKQVKWTSIKVNTLPETELQRIIGNQYELLNGQQRAILSNFQNLSIWMELSEEGKIVSFRSATELMRRFWESRKSKLESEGLNSDEVNSIIGTLISRLRNTRGRFCCVIIPLMVI